MVTKDEVKEKEVEVFFTARKKQIMSFSLWFGF